MLGSLGDCEQPGLIVNHVHVNQASLSSERGCNEPPEPLHFWGVIAVHSPKACLYSIRRDTLWMAEAACSVQTYSNMHGPLFSTHVFNFHTDKSNRRNGNYIMFAERGASSTLHESKAFSKYSEKKRPGGLSVWESGKVHSYIILHTSAESLQLYLAAVAELGSTSAAWFVSHTNCAAPSDKCENAA